MCSLLYTVSYMAVYEFKIFTRTFHMLIQQCRTEAMCGLPSFLFFVIVINNTVPILQMGTLHLLVRDVISVLAGCSPRISYNPDSSL